MAEEKDLQQQESDNIEDNKSTEVKIKKEISVAPEADKSTEETNASEAPDSQDVDKVLRLLNSLDIELGGKGEVAGIPDELKNTVKFAIETMVFFRDLVADPLWKAILDDLADQKEDGEVPSVEVAVARNVPLARLQELADSEDYAGAQSELADKLDDAAKLEEEEAAYNASFEETQKAGEAYAEKMGYDEAELQELMKFAYEQYKIWGDGKLDESEWSKVDKMRNYDKDVEDLRSQIRTQDSKEVLPDKPSVEAAIAKSPKTTTPVQRAQPGMSSMGSYLEEPEYLKTGKKRFKK